MNGKPNYPALLIGYIGNHEQSPDTMNYSDNELFSLSKE